MSINHSAEYIVLWKSHKREEWEAKRLKEEADALRRQAAAGPSRAGRPPGSGAAALAGVQPEAARHLESVARELEEESRRKQEFCSEIQAELARVASALTPAQRQEAEKVLKQWESAELAGTKGD